MVRATRGNAVLRRLLTRWANDAAKARVAELETELAKASARLSVVEAERDSLAAVVARDRARVEAETAAYHKATVVGK